MKQPITERRADTVCAIVPHHPEPQPVFQNSPIGDRKTTAARSTHRPVVVLIAFFAILTASSLSLSPVYGQSSVPPVVVTAIDSGWYRSDGAHDPDNTAYTAGGDGGFAYRNWFLFEMPVLTADYDTVSLSLYIVNTNNPGFQSGDPTETYRVREFGGSLSDLVARDGNGNGLSLFAALGPDPSGDDSTFDDADFTSSADNNGTFISILLPVKRRERLTVFASSRIALGGFVTTLNPDPDDRELVFGTPTVQIGFQPQLIFSQGVSRSLAAPEPGPLALALLPLAGVAVARRRRK